ncbi:MAG: iron-containing alcohol dehydrogenase [Clostridiales Family XIII bacterium]|jgi:alcohol dehydrogenase YqhD (iron-dependent ADH family)|nr:iron-containing alcohol dehydrogenase [Clostridiales Family XIII bacterium]
MNNFKLYLPTRLIFGKGEHKNIGKLMAPFAKKALIVFGSDRIKRNGVFAEVTASLAEYGIDYCEIGGVQPNPRVSLVYRGIELAKREGADAVLAVGGGSVIDSAKGIAAGVRYDGDIWEAYDLTTKGSKRIKDALPIAAILTIPAAGSEMSWNSVLSNEEKQTKYGTASDAIRPRVSIVNPEFFFTLPKNQIANGTADMMSHIFERYFTPTKHTDLTDALAEATLAAIMKNAAILMEHPENYDAWAEVAFSGTVAHNDILGVGRVQDWACHEMEHEISAIYDIPHGAGLAILTPNWMKYIYAEDRDMFLQFAVKVMGVSGGFRTKDDVILEGIARLRGFFNRLGLPAALADVGVDGSRIEEMGMKMTGAAFGLAETPIGGIKKIYAKDAYEIYKMSL